MLDGGFLVATNRIHSAGLVAGLQQRVIFSVLILLAPLVSADPQEQLANLVLQDCGSCHGMTLKGGLGPPLRAEDLARLPAPAIAAIIRDGVPGTAMPPWRALLSDQEIRWISEQLKAGALVAPQ